MRHVVRCHNSRGTAVITPPVKDLLLDVDCVRPGRRAPEADDVCATVAVKAAERGLRTAVVSSDRDLHQVVGETCFVVKPQGLVVDETFLVSEYGVPGSRWVEFAAVVGEKSDNLPGVPGFGPKRAQALVAEFPDAADAFGDTARVEALVGATLAGAFLDNRGVFELNRRVATLKTDLSVGATGVLPGAGSVHSALGAAGLASANVANALAWSAERRNT